MYTGAITATACSIAACNYPETTLKTDCQHADDVAGDSDSV